MKNLKKLFTVTALTAMLATQAVYSQPEAYYDESPAYEDCCCATNMCSYLPVGALVVAGILIATSQRSDHSHHRTCCSCSHAHFGSE